MQVLNISSLIRTERILLTCTRESLLERKLGLSLIFAMQNKIMQIDKLQQPRSQLAMTTCLRSITHILRKIIHSLRRASKLWTQGSWKLGLSMAWSVGLREVIHECVLS